MWTSKVPTETGWYWFRVDQERYPGLPDAITGPHLLWVAVDSSAGIVAVHDPVEPLCEFKAEDMRGYWHGPLVAPDFAQPATA